MAIKWPLANGNWSNAANWNDGTLPDVGDDVHADGKTVTIDQDVTVLSIRNDQRSGGTANGTFNFSSAQTAYNIVANLIGFNANLMTLNQGSRTYNFTGNISYINGATININVITINNSFITVNYIGDISTGFQQGRGGIILLSNYITLNVIGNLNGLGGLQSSAVSVNLSFNTINITGNISISGGQSAFGNSPSGLRIASGDPTITVYGNVLGSSSSYGFGILFINSSDGTLYLYGKATGVGSFSETAKGAIGIGTGQTSLYIEIDEAIGSNEGSQAITNLSSGGIVIVKKITTGENGAWPVYGNVKIPDTNFSFIAKTLNNQTVIFTDENNLVSEIPIESDVRNGISYFSNNRIGTLAVPDPSNVRKDIPTDNTVGTADLTAEDIWTYATRSLTEAPDVPSPQDIWEYENRSLTKAPDVPTAEEIATQVWEDQPERLKNVATVETTGTQLQIFLDQ